MPEPGSLFEPDSLEATTPLAWAIGGPKDDGIPGHPTLNQANADQIFILEGKVIDMKRLEQISKRLSKGIDLRIAKDGTLTFRARFRRKGQPLLSQTFPDHKLAEHWLQEQKRSALIGLHLPEMKTKTIIFKDAVDRYIKSILPLKPKNAHNSKRHLLFWVKELGDRPLFSITPEQIAAVRDRMLQEEIQPGKLRSPTTVIRYLGDLSHLFTVAIKEWGWIRDNPVSKIRKPQQGQGRTRFLSRDEIKLLLDAAQKSKCAVLYPIIVLALSSGMRRGEILGLRVKNVDIEHEQIILETTKNGDSRCVPLVGLTFDVLKELVKDKPNTALLFASPTIPNQPIDITKAWDNARRRAGLEKGVVFHSLRHTTGSHLALRGKSLHDIASLLGHKDIRVTARYSHLTNPYKAQMVKEISEDFFTDGNEKQI